MTDILHKDLIQAALNDEPIQWLNTAVHPHQWLTYLTPREAIHALVSFPDRHVRLKPQPTVLWAGVFKTRDGRCGTTGDFYERSRAADWCGSHREGKALVLRIELNPDTLGVVSATTEAP